MSLDSSLKRDSVFTRTQPFYPVVKSNIIWNVIIFYSSTHSFILIIFIEYLQCAKECISYYVSH